MFAGLDGGAPLCSFCFPPLADGAKPKLIPAFLYFFEDFPTGLLDNLVGAA